MADVEGFALCRGLAGETCPLRHRRDSPGEFSTVRLIDNNAALLQHGISLVGAPLLHVSLSTDRWICRLLDERSTQVRLKRQTRRAAGPKVIAEISPPERLLTRLVAILVDPPSVGRGNHLVCLALTQQLWACAEVRPPLVQLKEGTGMEALGANRILRAKADLLLTLADAREKVGWHGPPQIVDAGFEMLSGTRRHQRHLYHPYVPPGLP
ncbi:hypothetical protein ACSD7O_24515 [Methylorubrum extorquens]|uniref:hypothetical protein n=1 Tax=Methylorubrum extorquens TaxID=408 RepID=UPI003F61AB9F